MIEEILVKDRLINEQRKTIKILQFKIIDYENQIDTFNESQVM